jgi:hypothetical protein
MTCVEKREIFFWGGLIICSLGGVRWDGEEGEIEEEMVGRVVIY